ncbi:DNA polymerase epsilon subunit 4 [Aedes albopictus]|uniref:Transcription factor CBF/NF-Y/archaeal histone domain-containing protein n=1 Tax=Aedes albopictus TaxID=7160 RepID=A0ABM1YE59_AEDAL|nr:DNA polymerase epsilon subunit 4-like [Aedes albopictus]XP_029735326.1 DNA polymerase epsilon subunit 4 [Aedes albopictus]
MEDCQNSEKPANIRDFIDSEEIDFGSEPPVQQTVVEEQSEPLAPEEQFALEAEDFDELPEPDEIANDYEDPEVANDYSEDPEDTPESAENQEQPAASKTSRKEPSEQRLTQLPLSKIKSIMKCDPEVHIVSAEAIFLMTRAAELFVQTMAKEAHTHAVAGKKKTIARRDVDMTIESVDTLTFLEGMMNV